MTSRVQKGGPVFRPVAKSRARPVPSSSRQTSVSLEQSSNDVETSHINDSIFATRASNSMLPPPTIPIHQGSTPDPSTSQDILGSSFAESSQLSNRSSNSIESDFRTHVALMMQSAPPSTVSVVPERRAAYTPPVLTTYRTAVSTVGAVEIPDDASIPDHATSQIYSGGDIPSAASAGSTNMSQNVLQSSGTGNLPTLVLDEDDAVKPRRNSSRKRTGSVGGAQEQEVPDNSSEPVKKRRRKSQEDGEKKAPKRKRAVSKSVDGNDGVHEHKPRASSGTRRSRMPSLPPYDPDASPGEEIDPTVITMATLCSDTGQGRVSSKAAEILSNHAAWKASSREKRARMRLLMEAKKYGREEEDSEGQQKEIQAGVSTAAGSMAGPSNGPKSDVTVDSNDTAGGFDYSQDMETSRFNVQVRIGPNGETIIDEESLVVDRIEAEDVENYTHVVESDTTKFVNSGTYGKRFRGSRWSAEETELFYNALSQYGENYELIAYVLPGRDRKSCKNKFKIEDKKNHARINHCLNNSIPVDMKTLSKLTGKDFSGPVPDIRAPTPAPAPEQSVAVEKDPTIEEGSTHNAVKKRNRNKKSSSNEGVVIIGDVDNFES